MEFFNFWASGKGCYKLEGKPCALIINNVFDDEQKRENVPDYDVYFRQGARSDSERMGDLFEKWLDFEFVDTHYWNVRKTAMKCTSCLSQFCSRVPPHLSKVLTDFRDQAKRQRCSSCFIVIMSHEGFAANSITMDDLEEVDLYGDIVYPFSNHDDFRRKPKIFIVQACRNSRDAPAIGQRQDSRLEIQDVLIAHSTIPHEFSYRSVENGALFINEMVRTFMEGAHEEPLDTMLGTVFLRLKREWGQHSNFENMGFREYRFKI